MSQVSDLVKIYIFLLSMHYIEWPNILCSHSTFQWHVYEKASSVVVMAVVGIEIVREGGQQRWARHSTRGATVPRVLFTRWRRLGFWGCRGAGNAGRGALPTTGKREGISF